MSNGFPGGRINSISQSTDGYLWIGTSKGLVRFDGFNFVTIGESNQSSEPISQALALVADGDGALWVWDQTTTVRRYHNGRLDDVTYVGAAERDAVAAITRSNEGNLLVATLGPKIFRYRDGKSESITGDSNLWTPPPQTLAETTDGKIWMATYEAGLFYWERGHTTAVSKGIVGSKINCLLPVGNGELWIGTDNGLALWNGKEISSNISSRALRGTRVLSLSMDRDANLWIGTSGGLFRLDSGGLSLMEDVRKASNRTITAIFEDREGNLWVGDAEGIERLSDGLFTTYSGGDNSAAESGGPVYTDVADRAWFAPSRGGLYCIVNGKAIAIAPTKIGRDVIYSITGYGDDLWVGRRDAGLTHLSHLDAAKPDALTVKTYNHSHGLAQNSVSSVFRSLDGTIWAGTLSGGVSSLKDGKFSTLTSSDGLGSNTVSSIREGIDGSIWFATSDGLSQLLKGKLKTYRVRDGLPSDEVTTLLTDSSGIIWVGTSQGLAYFSSGHITSVADTLPVLHESIFGVAEDKQGYLWMTSSNHIFRVSRTELLKNKPGDQDYREYGEEDGLRGTEGVRRDRSVAADASGRIWLSTTHGISMVDRTVHRGGASPALPHVESISSDGRQINLDGPIRIEAAPQRISLTYEAVSLAVPNRVRYRYKLEGFDHAWSDPTEARQVVYTNLGPESYRFRLLASDSNGGWDGTETIVSFKIQPTIWQTWWFRVLFCISLVGILWLFYLYRLKLATARILERLDARLEERERIARELHDTLLQGFQGLTLRLHAVLKSLPPQEPAYQKIERVLDRADEVLIEGRERVKDLRQVHMAGDDLSEVLMHHVEEWTAESSTLFSVVVIGKSRGLGPVVFNEVSQIAREALFNCFQHAKASKVEAELTYTNTDFSLRIVDDGVGIDKALAHRGRAGHWGLAGMRERAQKVGGRLDIWTRSGGGTEIELSIPAKLAFYSSPRTSVLGRLNHFVSRRK